MAEPTLRSVLHDVAELTRVDSLTGIGNRRRLTDLAATSSSHPHLLVVVEVDGIDRVADEHGHATADAALQAVAHRLSVMPGAWILARTDGARFAAVHPVAAGHPGAMEAAREVQAALEPPLVIGGRHLALTPRLGLAEGADGTDLTTSFGRASACCAIGRSRGTTEPVIWDPHIQRATTLRRDLARALTTDQIEVLLQPQVSLEDGRVAGCEALLRWHHPLHGEVRPGEFIGLVEQFHLTDGLSATVLEVGLAHLDAVDPTRQLRLAINLSPLELSDPALVDRLAALWARGGPRRRPVCLEITETTHLAAIADAPARIASLRAAGFAIALDDFGTGLGALDALLDHGVDELKVDRRVVEHLASAPATAIVEALGLVARRLGLDLVAEGVEAPDQPAALAALGCNVGQGFLWAPALTVTGLRSWLAART